MLNLSHDVGTGRLDHQVLLNFCEIPSKENNP